ncbi:PREDICTED: uncharacterized protein LOC105571227 [Vollenhovia emeryi]|uniref:uncharacterized protein LOC105571227 n=1 Tax=Vollenhovia emeryi TaxID=411798 RepID=UPI0005F38C3C|nr:PREDICTED: uncharacterized protein LOC105571227 [Vollenhovia emeryi]
MKPDPGFVGADSRNLPEINSFMVIDYVKHEERFNDPEVRNSKMSLSSRVCYGDSAIGYVSLRRQQSICTLKARVCPEHRVRNTPYTVTMLVNEEQKIINSVECEDCPAALGGCKHAIALLMWAHRRSEQKSATQVDCYWKKSALAKVGTPKQYIKATELFTNKNVAKATSTENYVEKHETFVKNVMECAKQKQLDSQISRHWFDLESRQIRCLSLHQLIINFLETGKNGALDFFSFAKNCISEELCEQAEIMTRNQSNEHLWFELRYGRITASKIYEAARCKTSDGSLVNEIIGASKVFESKEMKRGKELERKILLQVQKILGLRYRTCGFYLIPGHPVIGGSPDAVGDDFTLEVKAPATLKGYNRFLPEGSISAKCKAQMYLQMYCTKKKKGLFCVADPEFEKNKKVTTIWLFYDENFTMIIERAIQFWINNIFPRLLKSVQ